MLLPEPVFIEAAPHRVLFNVQDKLGLALLELDHIRLGDAGDRVAAGAHPPTVDFVAAIDDGNVAHHRAAFFRVDVQLLPQRSERDFQVLQNDQSYGDEGGREWLKGRQKQKTDGAEQH